MNNKINLDNRQIREYIQLLESTGASREVLGQFFQETYGVDVNNFNTQYNLVNSIEIDKMKHTVLMLKILISNTIWLIKYRLITCKENYNQKRKTILM